MNDADLVQVIIEKLQWLRLPGMVRSLESILEIAKSDNLSTLDAIGRLADEEKASRLRSAVERRIRDAKFPEVNTIDGFDFDFATTRKKLRHRYLALHDLTFISRGINPVFIGDPGRGKTYLARALAFKACQANKRVVFVPAIKMLNELGGAELHGRMERTLRKYVKAELLVIDDFASLEMDSAQAKHAFQVISERYDHRRSTSITTNRAFKDWPKVFPDALNAQVIAERLTERCETFVLNGKGYRRAQLTD